MGLFFIILKFFDAKGTLCAGPFFSLIRCSSDGILVTLSGRNNTDSGPACMAACLTPTPLQRWLLLLENECQITYSSIIHSIHSYS